MKIAWLLSVEAGEVERVRWTELVLVIVMSKAVSSVSSSKPGVEGTGQWSESGGRAFQSRVETG